MGKGASLPRRFSYKKYIKETDLEKLCIETDISSNVIEDLYKKFLHHKPDGKMDKNEFIKFYCSLRPEPEEKLNNIAEFIFTSFDQDQNGFIDVKEFIIAYVLTTRGTLAEKLTYAFDMYDHNKNGYLERNEVSTVIEAMLSLLEAENKLESLQQITNECMNVLDVSNDGKISKEEFVEGLSKNFALRSIMCPFN